ncbi:acyltransferase domain-containing protein [Actinomadura nitritigenes]|uniref:[acyl-carrier-protein] S-malonyltransferase n=2 Tax=Actinomadura nitritigenes TaxID=134602 RepID=A0ABS3R5K0_9ACTN|nr:acyltransferase domain-containing protein [Actinomadura nitritigenes]MBO2440874.1 acyltransferase domain-containing protein [Actinomadura nitritigenes]
MSHTSFQPDGPFDPAGELKPDDVCAFLFAGTGSAGVPDLPSLARSGPAAARAAADVLDAVQEGLPDGWPSMRAILLEDPAGYRAAARVPGVAQLAGYASSVAVDRALRALGVQPGFAVGQSFGEIAAMVCAGVFAIADGARMAVSLVDVLARRGAGGGMALLEAGEDGARACIDDAAAPEVVVACLNAPSVTVVSGPDAPLEAVLRTARDSGVRAVRLAVPYLSHHPAMAGADDEWYAMIRAYPQRPLELVVHSPVRGRAYRDDDDLHRALADCIVKPVRLPEALRAVHAAGATVFAEAGSGNALCQCARLSVPDAQTFLVPLRDRPRQGAPRPRATETARGAADAIGADGPPVGKSAPGITPDPQP